MYHRKFISSESLKLGRYLLLATACLFDITLTPPLIARSQKMYLSTSFISSNLTRVIFRQASQVKPEKRDVFKSNSFKIEKYKFKKIFTMFYSLVGPRIE